MENRVDNIEEKAEKVRELIKNDGKYLVVEDSEKKEIVWMLIYWPSRNPEYPNSWEINAIYVLQNIKNWALVKIYF